MAASAGNIDLGELIVGLYYHAAPLDGASDGEAGGTPAAPAPTAAAAPEAVAVPAADEDSAANLEASRQSCTTHRDRILQMLVEEPNNQNLIELRDQLTDAINQLQGAKNMIQRSRSSPNFFWDALDHPVFSMLDAAEQQVHRGDAGAPSIATTPTCERCKASNPGDEDVDYRFCGTCFALHEQQGYCVVCYDDITEEEGPMVSCDTCDFLVHIECDGISERGADFLAAKGDKAPYHCPRCTGKPPGQFGADLESTASMWTGGFPSSSPAASSGARGVTNNVKIGSESDPFGVDFPKEDEEGGTNYRSLAAYRGGAPASQPRRTPIEISVVALNAVNADATLNADANAVANAGVGGRMKEWQRCKQCSGGESKAGNEILLCDGLDCLNSFHQQCCMPVVTTVPKGAWRCPECVDSRNMLDPERVQDEYGKLRSSVAAYKAHITRALERGDCDKATEICNSLRQEFRARGRDDKEADEQMERIERVRRGEQGVAATGLFSSRARFASSDGDVELQEQPTKRHVSFALVDERPKSRAARAAAMTAKSQSRTASDPREPLVRCLLIVTPTLGLRLTNACALEIPLRSRACARSSTSPPSRSCARLKAHQM